MSWNQKISTGKIDLKDPSPRKELPSVPGFRFSSMQLEGLRTAIYAALSLALTGLLGFSELGQWLTANFDRPLVYRVRDYLGKSPSMAPNFVPVLFDDAALTWLGSVEPGLNQWASMLDVISERRPAAIVVNKVFGVLPHGSTASEADSFVRTLKKIRLRDSVPVIAGGYFSVGKSEFKNPVSGQYLDDSNTVSWGLDRGLPMTDQLERLGFPVGDRSKEFFYGPDARIQGAFSGLGMVNYQLNGLLPVGAKADKNLLIPHLAFTPFQNKNPGDGFVFLNGVKVPVNRRGEILPNIANRNALIKQSISMKHFLDSKTRDYVAQTYVKKGDIVFIGFNTTDAADAVVPTPAGRLPASLVVASIINSIASRQIIREVPYPEFWWSLGAILSIGLLVRLPVSFAILVLTGSILLWPFSSVLIFTFLGVHVPWLVPAAGALLAGMAAIARKLKVSRENAIRVAAALDGRIPRETMKSLVKNPERIELSCREVPVTLMFIDIAGFSLFAERRAPQEVFEYLRSALGQATRLVLEYGGIVDKTTGDGLLAYFGQSIGSIEGQRDHATRAFQCAIAIQENRLGINRQAIEKKGAVLPLRIGINTATCMLGDLGTEERLDVTVVGGGVNFAKRLEDACDPGTILVSSTTYSLAVPVGHRAGFVRKFVRVKHMNALVECFEFDPLANDPQTKVKLTEAFRSTIAIERVDRRWVVPDEKAIELVSELGTTTMINFSGRGFAARLPAPFARGSRISFRVRTDAVAQELARHGVRELDAEVRWNHGTGETVFHGFSIQGFSEEQAAAFNKVLMDYCFAEDLFSLPKIG